MNPRFVGTDRNQRQVEAAARRGQAFADGGEIG
jgi:hypothetical protein